MSIPESNIDVLKVGSGLRITAYCNNSHTTKWQSSEFFNQVIIKLFCCVTKLEYFYRNKCIWNPLPPSQEELSPDALWSGKLEKEISKTIKCKGKYIEEKRYSK
jgi:hypothetical protein